MLKGKALLLLDGLDLLTPFDSFSPFDEISDFISEYEDCRYIIASRPGPFDSIKSTFAVSELEALTDEKIKYFVEKNVPNKRQAKLLKTKILNEVNSKPVLRNPLLLHLWINLSIAQVGMREKKRDIQLFTPFDSVPSSRAELYLAFISELFEECKIREDFFSSQNILPLRESTEGTNPERAPSERINCQKVNVERIDIEYFLMDLSFKLQCRNKISCKYSSVLEVAEQYIKYSTSRRVETETRSDRVETRSHRVETEIRSHIVEARILQACLGLGLLTRDKSEVKFGINRSFQEYFAALKLKTYLENGTDIPASVQAS